MEVYSTSSSTLIWALLKSWKLLLRDMPTRRATESVWSFESMILYDLTCTIYISSSALCPETYCNETFSEVSERICMGGGCGY